MIGEPEVIQMGTERIKTVKSSAVSEVPPSEELRVETLCRGASDTAT